MYPRGLPGKPLAGPMDRGVVTLFGHAYTLGTRKLGDTRPRDPRAACHSGSNPLPVRYLWRRPPCSPRRPLCAGIPRPDEAGGRRRWCLRKQQPPVPVHRARARRRQSPLILPILDATGTPAPAPLRQRRTHRRASGIRHRAVAASALLRRAIGGLLVAREIESAFVPILLNVELCSCTVCQDISAFVGIGFGRMCAYRRDCRCQNE